MKAAKRVLAVVAAATAAAGVLAVTAPPAHAACTTFYYQVTPHHLFAWESKNFEERDFLLYRDEYVRGTGGSRSNGWTPVEHWKYNINNGSEPWKPLLLGVNDTHDFIRTSGLDYIRCL